MDTQRISKGEILLLCISLIVIIVFYLLIFEGYIDPSKIPFVR